MLTLLRVRESPKIVHGLTPGGLYVLIGVVRQKTALCVVMKFDSGVTSVQPVDAFEVVPKSAAP